MDYSVKKNKAARFYKLKLSRYSGGHSVTAIKVVHDMDDGNDMFSQSHIHTHDYYELVVVIRGTGKHPINSMCLPIKPGSVFLLRPGDSHRYEYTEPLELLNFMFNSHILKQFGKDLRMMPGYDLLFVSDDSSRQELSVDSATIAMLDILLNTIATESRQNIPGSDLVLASSLINAIVLILRNIRHEGTVPAANGDISSAVSYMYRNFHSGIRISELARQSHLSDSSFYRKFHAEFGMSPVEWLLKLRIRKAMEFLIRSDMSTGEVANAIGFSDQLYFSRQFRKIAGCSPREYRSQEHGSLQIVRGDNSFNVIKQ